MNEIGQSAGKNLAWLAGYINGDGTLTLNKQRMGKGRIIYTPLVGLTGTDHSLIEEVAEIFKSIGVGFYVTKYATQNGIAKKVFVKGFKRVQKLLPLLIPELRGKKKQQAILLLEWINSREQTGNNCTYTDYELQLFAQIKELKKPD